MKYAGTPLDLIMESSLDKPVQKATLNIPKVWQWRFFSLSLVLLDALIIATAFRLAYFIRFETDLPIFVLEVVPSIAFYERLVALLIPIWLVSFAFSGLYNRHNLIGGTKEYSKLFNAATFGMFMVVAAGFLVPEFVFSRAWLLLSWLISGMMLTLGRFSMRRVVYAFRKQGYLLSPTILVGANEEGYSLAEQLQYWRTSGLLLVGFISDEVPSGARVRGGLTNLGTLQDIDEIVKKHHIEEIVLTSSALTRNEILEIFQKYGVCKDVNVRMSSGLYEIITTGLQVKEFAYVPLVGINKVRLTGIDSILKFALDYAITLPGMILALPLMGLMALAVKLESPGPVIHRRRVMGVNGTHFDAFKFRTMHVNGDAILDQHPELKAELARNHKLKDDPRVTRVGKWLRKTSMDELPQLFNVLRREMSLVGPRMIAPAEMEMYQQFGMNLLTVKPGITGLWQVSGRSDVTYAERVRLDMFYIRNWSIWLDLQLLFQTIPAVLFRRGAY